ncbi:unknown [Feldmannia species virus]|uniref:Uncharacterized protein n=1 Tax=Feldmannia species virus TaxID=39420 RepID=B5LWF4_9PHYC|nr:hypothetical protein FeldSpV_gp065 [Feldmannia species virus]ACH46817.1 unknown [Feldmannia species virus]
MISTKHIIYSIILLVCDYKMDFDLVSAFSARIFWKADFTAASVHCVASGSAKPIAAQCSNDEAAVVVVNLEPGTTYAVSVRSAETKSPDLYGSFTTKSSENPELSALYSSIRTPEGIFDTTRFDTKLHDIFVENFSSIVSPGDRILAKVVVNGAPQEVMTVAASGEGSSFDVDAESNIFLPFHRKTGEALVQTVTLRHPTSADATLVYDSSTDNLAYGGDHYGVGDKFELFNRTVTVADGSIVLLFSDTVAKTWPFDASKALSVVGSAGSHFMKNITCNTHNLVGQKIDGETGSTYNSAWIHNTDDSSTLEVSRMVHEVDEDSANATLSLGVLHTDSSNQKFIEPALSLQATATTISAQNDDEQTTSATFQSTGLSFDTDDAAIYFGSSQNFRIKFSSGTPSVLQIQSFDDASDSYITRQEFTDAT